MKRRRISLRGEILKDTSQNESVDSSRDEETINDSPCISSSTRVGTRRRGTSTNKVESTLKSETRKVKKESSPLSSIIVEQEKALRIKKQLLPWFEENHRHLPWRVLQMYHQTDRHDKAFQQNLAYKVWISEIMLQQTQVQTVLSYFTKWMTEIPTLSALASTSLERVNQLWSGLGYYRRAKYLLHGAQYVERELEGIIPSDVPSLLKIPGIGRYTAGAISSIAFGEPAPILDGNVLRLVSRLYALKDDIAQNSVRDKIFWPIAESLVTASHMNDIKIEDGEKDNPQRPPVDLTLYGDFNQALMEMGATVCVPKNPICEKCPVADLCEAKAQLQRKEIPSIEECYPFKAKAKKKKELFAVSCIIARTAHNGERELLMEKRGPDGLLANLWQFPTVELPGLSDSTSNAEPPSTFSLFLESIYSPTDNNNNHRLAKMLHLSSIEEWDSVSRVNNERVRHIFTHIDLLTDVWTAVLPPLDKPYQQGSSTLVDSGDMKWVKESELSGEALSTLVRKIYLSSKKHVSANGMTKKRKSPSEDSSRKLKQRKLSDY